MSLPSSNRATSNYPPVTSGRRDSFHRDMTVLQSSQGQDLNSNTSKPPYDTTTTPNSSTARSTAADRNPYTTPNSSTACSTTADRNPYTTPNSSTARSTTADRGPINTPHAGRAAVTATDRNPYTTPNISTARSTTADRDPYSTPNTRAARSTAADRNPYTAPDHTTACSTAADRLTYKTLRDTTAPVAGAGAVCAECTCRGYRGERDCRVGVFRAARRKKHLGARGGGRSGGGGHEALVKVDTARLILQVFNKYVLWSRIKADLGKARYLFDSLFESFMADSNQAPGKDQPGPGKGQPWPGKGQPGPSQERSHSSVASRATMAASGAGCMFCGTLKYVAAELWATPPEELAGLPDLDLLSLVRAVQNGPPALMAECTGGAPIAKEVRGQAPISKEGGGWASPRPKMVRGGCTIP
eukprot:gene22608-29749_t